MKERISIMKKECGARAASILMTLLMLFAGSASGWADEVIDADDLEREISNGGIIDMTENITDASCIYVTKNVTLNLNGHSISGNNFCLCLKNGSNLTINGGEGGSITSKYYNIIKITEQSTATLNDVTSTNSSKTGIDVAEGCTLTVNGGSITVEIYGIANSGTTTVYNCSISGSNSAIANEGALTIKSGVTLNGGISDILSKGTVTYDAGIAASVTTYDTSTSDHPLPIITYYSSFDEAVTAANAATSPVTIQLLDDIDLGQPTDSKKLICIIVFGEFKDTSVRDITLDLNGHTLTGKASGRIIGIDGDNTSVTITDSSPGQTGTISNTYNTTINEVISNGAKLTFKAGNIRNQYSEGIKNSGQLNVTGGTIITKEDAIFNNQGTATISNCTVSGNIGINNNGDMTIGENVSIIKCSYAGLIYSANTTLNVLPDFGTGNNANDVDIRVNIPKKIVFGENFSAPAIPLANKIKVNIYEVSPGYGDPALYVFTQGYGTTFTDGTTGETVDPADVFTISGANIVLVGGEAVAYDTTKPLVAYNTASDGSLTGLYAPNGDNITTEAAALTAAVNALADGSTLTLCKDVDLGDDDIYILKGTAAQPVTIDLNDYKITGKDDYGVLQVGESAITPTVIIKNGTIENSCTENSQAINNYGNLTMSDVSVAGYSAIGNYSTGTLTFKSGTITATGSNGFGIDNTGTLTVSGGIIDGKSVPAIYNNSNAPSCTIGAATIKSDNNLGIKAEGNVTLTAWPTFSGNSTDIDLINGVKIVLGDGFAVPASEFNKIKVSVGGSAPFTITSGYAAHCKDGQNKVLDPTSVFTWSGSGSYVLVLDGGEVKVKYYTVITLGSETIEIDALDRMHTYASLTPAGAGSLVCTSDDERVATVSEGIITAVGVGSCTITVSFPGNDGYAPAESKTIAVSVSLPSMTVTLPAGLSTYYEGYGLRVRNTEGVKMYAVTAVSDDLVTLKEISNRTIPAYTPVIINNTGSASLECLFEYTYDKDSENNFAQTFATDLGTATLAKEFVGTDGPLDAYVPDQGITMYGLNGAAFVKIDGKPNIPAHRCWLEIPGTASAKTRTLTIVFDGGDATGVKEVKGVIDDTWYTIDGRKLSGKPTKKGIYIRRSTSGRLQGKNGKKHVIK